MKIAVNAIGTNPASEMIIEGAGLAIKELPPQITLVLIGNEAILHPLLEKHQLSRLPNLEIKHTTEEISKEDHPTKALQKPNADISIGFNLLKSKEIDVFCGLGNDAAVHLCSTYITKSLPGVIRPGLAGFLPNEEGGYTIILDAGANTECKPDVLQQFSRMGSVLAKNLFSIPNPKVSLLASHISEGGKPITTESAYQLISNFEKINFGGYLNPDELFSGQTDVVICDGFSGNMVLKMAESFYALMEKRNFLDTFLQRFNPHTIGSKAILGINGNVILGPAQISSDAIKNMLLLANKVAKGKINSKIKEAFGD